MNDCMRAVKGFVSLLLAAGVLLGAAGCSAKSDKDGNGLPVGSREGAISLNGNWDFYADSQKSASLFKKDKGGDERLALAGRIAGMKLDVGEDVSSRYVKALARVLIEPDARPAEGERGSRLAVRANGGEWAELDVRYYMNGQAHWIDLPVRREDLVTGENKIELRTTLGGGVYLLGDAVQGSGSAYTVEDTEETALPERQLCLRLKACSPGTNWQTVTVPAAFEGQFEVGYADAVYPDTFNGVGWYRREITLPGDKDDKDVWLCFDAADYKAEVWLNGRFLGSHEGGYTGFEFNLRENGAARFGEKNTLVVRVIDQDWNNGLTDDDIPIKETLAGFVQDTRKLNYGGLWQNVYLESRGRVITEDVFVDTDIAAGTATAEITVYNATEEAQEAAVLLEIVKDGEKAACSVTVEPKGTAVLHLTAAVKNPRLWDVDSPNLYTARVTVTSGNSTDTLDTPFGLRRVETSGNKILVNGSPVFLTGMLHWGSYYDNYTPAVSVQQIEKELTELKKAGFNAVKYCLVVPPDYIMDIYDRMGMYMYIEYPIWNPTETDAFFERSYLQMMELVKAGRNHPCLILSDFNCEDLEFTPEMDALMSWCVGEAKTVAPNRLYTDNSSNGAHKYGDFTTCHPYYQVNCYEDMLEGWIAERGAGKPMILGEFADISVLRDLAALNAQSTEKYTWYHEYFGDYDDAKIMRDAGYTEEQVQAVIQASVDNAQELRKFYLEASKANSTVAGLFLTHIFESPNGWADGWFDDLYKPHFDAAFIRRSAAEEALLLDRETLNYWAGGTAALGASVSFYGGRDLTGGKLTYALKDSGKTVKSGTISADVSLKGGGYYGLGDFQVTFPESAQAIRYELELTLEGGGKKLVNSWNLWAYPAAGLSEGSSVQVYDPGRTLELRERYPWMSAYTGTGDKPEVIVTTQLTGSILNHLTNGGKVVYLGVGDGPVKVTENWDYNRMSFAFLPDAGNSLAASLKNGGYGGLQFLELATRYHMEVPDGGTNLVGRWATTQGSIGSYIQERASGQGLLIQSTLRHNSAPFTLGGGLLTHESLSAGGYENVLGEYLIDQMVLYALQK